MGGKVIYIIFLTLMVACSKNTTNYSAAVTPTQKEKKEVEKPGKETQVWMALFQWFDFKKNNRLLNCGQSSIHELEVLGKPDKGFLYDYCLVNGNQTKEKRNSKFRSTDKVLEVVVHKYDNKIGSYEDRNEKLLFIKSRTENTDLGEFDLVGSQKKYIEKRFSKPLKELNGVSVYSSKRNYLVCKYDTGNKVLWFKYYVENRCDKNEFIRNPKVFLWNK